MRRLDFTHLRSSGSLLSKYFLETFSKVLLVSLFFDLADGDDINYFVRKVM